jgi:hypothetical protein
MISVHSLRNFVMIATLASSTVHAAELQSLDRTLEPYLKEFSLPAKNLTKMSSLARSAR